MRRFSSARWCRCNSASRTGLPERDLCHWNTACNGCNSVSFSAFQQRAPPAVAAFKSCRGSLNPLPPPRRLGLGVDEVFGRSALVQWAVGHICLAEAKSFRRIQIVYRTYTHTVDVGLIVCVQFWVWIKSFFLKDNFLCHAYRGTKLHENANVSR